MNIQKKIMTESSTSTAAPTKYWSNLLEELGRKQDKQVFEEIHSHFAPLIRGFLQAKSGGMSYEASEELMQEVMIKVWLKASSYDSKKAAASTWIFTLARNARIDFLRKYARQTANTDPLLTDDIWDEDEPNQPFTYLHQDRTGEQVKKMLMTLSNEQRQCLQKVYMEGKSHSEISNELSLPLGTVKSRVRLGLKKLQSSLETV